MASETLLPAVGARVRSLREYRKMSRRRLAERSGVCERYLGQLEAGTGNISLVRFAAVAEALGTSPAKLLDGISLADQKTTVIALVGMRGAGKSAVGVMLAAELGVPFVEIDQLIEERAGLRLSEIFELHGEAYYRRLEREALDEVLVAGNSTVIATGGSVVSHAENYSRLKERACTVWLRAKAEEHWERVIAQGDVRPMAKRPDAFTELHSILNARTSLYAEARHIIDTSNRSAEEVAALVGSAVGGELPPSFPS